MEQPEETKPMDLRDLIGKDLIGFRVALMWEVYYMDCEGLAETGTVGCFKTQEVAESFAEHKDYTYKARSVPVLTNDTVAFSLLRSQAVTLMNDEAEAVTLREEALKKLTVAERRILKV